MATLDELEQQVAARERELAQAAPASPSAPDSIPPQAPTALDELERQVVMRERALEQERRGGQSPVLNAVEDVGSAVKGTVDAVARGADRTVGDYFRGFNRQLSEVLGYPADLVRQGLVLAGGEFAKGRPSAEVIREGMGKIGINVPEEKLNSFLGRTGEETVNQVLGFLGARAVAPQLSAMPRQPGVTPTPMQTTLGQIGDDLIQRPVTNVAGAVAAAPGAVAGKDLGGAAGEAIAGDVGRQVGEVLGGTVGGIATGIPGQQFARKRGIGASEAPPLRGELPAQPITNREAIPQRMQEFSAEQVAQQKGVIDQQVDDLIANLSNQAVSPEQRAIQMRADLQRTYETARAIEGDAWRAVPNQQINLDGYVPSAIHNIYREFAGYGQNWTPDRIITNFLERLTNPAHGGGQQGLPMSMDDIRKFRSSIFQEKLANQGSTVLGTPPNRQMVAALNQLDDALLRALDAQYQGNVQYQQARALTQHVRETFSEGPVGELFALDKRANNRVEAAQSLRTLLSDPQGLDSLFAATQPVGYVRNANRAAALIRNQDQLANSTGEAIQREFQSLLQDEVHRVTQARLGSGRADGAAEVAAQRLAERTMQRWAPMLEQWGNVLQRLDGVTGDLDRLVAQRRELSEGWLARAAQANPERLVQQLLGSTRPDVAARSLMAELAADPQRIGQSATTHAQEALKEMLVRKLLEGAGDKSPTAAMRRLESRTWRPLMEAVLSPQEMERLNGLIAVGQRVEAGDWQTPSEKTRATVASWAGRIMGIHAGSKLVRVVNGSEGSQAGSLMFPARLGNAGAQFMDAIFNRTPDPVGLLARAVTDPEVERQLMERVPGGLKDMETAYRNLRGLVLRINTGIGTAQEQFMAGVRERAKKDLEPGDRLVEDYFRPPKGAGVTPVPEFSLPMGDPAPKRPAGSGPDRSGRGTLP